MSSNESCWIFLLALCPRSYIGWYDNKGGELPVDWSCTFGPGLLGGAACVRTVELAVDLAVVQSSPSAALFAIELIVAIVQRLVEQTDKGSIVPSLVHWLVR